MESNRMINVNPNFDMDVFANRLTESFTAKGYAVNSVKMGESYSITFEKDIGGINMVLGMGVGIKANITRNGDTVNIAFTDAEWTSKIIGAVVGWFLCWIPLVTAIIGFIKQNDLPKTIANEAAMIAASF